MYTKITQQIYSISTDGKIQLNYRCEFGTVLNLTGFIWVDTKYNFLKSLLINNPHRHTVLITDSDLISHDDYMETILPDVHTIVFICTSNFNKRDKTGCETFLGQQSDGASRDRLKAAQAKLKTVGFKTKYFVNEQAAIRFAERELKKRSNP